MSGFFPSMCNFKTFEAHLNMLKLSLKLSGSRGASASNSDTSHSVSQAASTLQSSSRSSLHHAARGSARSTGGRNLKVTPESLLRCGQKASTDAHPQLFLHGIHGHAVLPWAHRAAPPPTLPALSPRDHTVLFPPVLHCAAMAGKPSCSLSAFALPRKTFSSQFCTC